MAIAWLGYACGTCGYCVDGRETLCERQRNSGYSVVGSIVGTRQDLAEVFALHAAGRTQVVSESRKLDDVNTAMAEVLSGRVPARLVFDF